MEIKTNSLKIIVISFLLIKIFSLLDPLLSHANSDNVGVGKSTVETEGDDGIGKDIDIIESIQYFPAPELSTEDKVISFDLEGVDEESGEIVDEARFKDSLLEFFNTDPDKYQESIKNIDSIVQQSLYNQEGESGSKNNDFELGTNHYLNTVLSSGWEVKPRRISSENRVKYKTSWLIEDNYRSSIPITLKRSTSSETSIGIGFSGEGLIRNFFGFSLSKSQKQTATTEIGAKISAWTAWGTRPYIRYRLDKYQGIRYATVLVGSRVETRHHVVHGSNNVLRVKANEYWSRTNSKKNVNASTPRPPAGAPA